MMRRAVPELIVASSLADFGPVPGYTDFRQDANLTRLYAIWTSETPFIDGIIVRWRFDQYGGVFQPTADDRELDAPTGRLIYEYNPDPNGPFRQGTFHDKEWEAWTITAPAPDVQTAEISVSNSSVGVIVMLGAAITRNGQVVMSDGPTYKTAHCLYNFE